MKKPIIAALITIASVAGHAQRAGMAGGVGRHSCGEYQQARVKGLQFQAVYAAWVEGLLSGYNVYATQPQINAFPAPAAIVAYLDDYCRDHPSETVMRASSALIADFGGYRPPYLKK